MAKKSENRLFKDWRKRRVKNNDPTLTNKSKIKLGKHFFNHVPCVPVIVVFMAENIVMQL